MSEAGLPVLVREERVEIEEEGVMKRTKEQAHTEDWSPQAPNVTEGEQA